MKSPHILLAGGNVKQLQMNLVNVIDANAMRAIETEINMNTKNLYLLGKTHFLFAIKHLCGGLPFRFNSLLRRSRGQRGRRTTEPKSAKSCRPVDETET